MSGIGTTQCYGGFEWPTSGALWTVGPQERLEPANAGTVVRIHWSPSSIAFRVALSRPATLVVDQNFDRGWRSSEGRSISRDGLLALPLPSGEREVTLRHRPDGFGLGLAMTVLGLGLSALALRSLAPPAGSGAAVTPLADSLWSLKSQHESHGWHILQVDGFVIFDCWCGNFHAAVYVAPVVTLPFPAGTTWHWLQSTG